MALAKGMKVGQIWSTSIAILARLNEAFFSRHFGKHLAWHDLKNMTIIYFGWPRLYQCIWRLGFGVWGQQEYQENHPAGFWFVLSTLSTRLTLVSSRSRSLASVFSRSKSTAPEVCFSCVYDKFLQAGVWTYSYFAFGYIILPWALPQRNAHQGKMLSASYVHTTQYTYLGVTIVCKSAEDWNGFSPSLRPNIHHTNIGLMERKGETGAVEDCAWPVGHGCRFGGTQNRNKWEIHPILEPTSLVLLALAVTTSPSLRFTFTFYDPNWKRQNPAPQANQLPISHLPHHQTRQSQY